MQLYAVIRTGGKDYRVSPGHSVKIERIEAEPGEILEFGEVSQLAKGDQVVEGNPLVEGARVRAQVLKHGQDKGIIVFKMKRRQLYKDKFERQWQYTTLKINEIIFGDDVFKKRDIDPRKIKKAAAAEKALEARKAKAISLPQQKPESKANGALTNPAEPVRPAPEPVVAKTAAPLSPSEPAVSLSRQRESTEKVSRKGIGLLALLALLLVGFLFWNRSPDPQAVATPDAKKILTPEEVKLLSTRPVDRPSEPSQPRD